MASSLPALSPSTSPTDHLSRTPRSFHGFASLHSNSYRISPQKSLPLMERRGRKFTPLCVTSFHTHSSATSHTLADDPATRTGRSPGTLYDVLRIPQTASETDVKAAYRRLARQYHPDVVPLQDKDASTKMFLQIHAAYAALSDPQSRARYDLQLSLEAFQATGAKARGMRTPQPSPVRTSSSYYSPRSSSYGGRPRSWETDQCW